jgi:N-acyl homoserine lactone hydrolase
MKNTLLVAMLAMLAGCAGTGRDGAVERMYVIDCGENRTNDVSRWTPGVNVGKPAAFSNHCYLIQHAKGLMLWDSGNPDRLAALPNGLTNPAGTITAIMRKPLAESLRELSVAPSIIQHFAMSHSHGDHSGNANLFGTSTLYMQEAEYNAVFGPEPQKFNFIPANFEAFRGKRVMVLKGGDHDVFGDGSVMIKPAPGHTPGHQVLVVRLPKTGPVMLSGDMVHLLYSWQNRVVPSFNFDVAQSGRTIDEMKAYAERTGTQLWINHDMEQHARIPKAPAFVE